MEWFLLYFISLSLIIADGINGQKKYKAIEKQRKLDREKINTLNQRITYLEHKEIKNNWRLKDFGGN